MKNRLFTVLLTAAVFGLGSAVNAAEISSAEAMKAISAAVLPAMERTRFLVWLWHWYWGDKTYVFNYGVSDVEKQTPVTDETIFEIGSISKTFTATLATHAEATGKLKLTDTAAKYLPELAGTDFGNLQLFHLGMHTVGGISSAGAR